MTTLNLYEKYFYAWTEEQAKLIKQKAFSQLDLVHIQEEIKSMEAREKSELKNRLAQLLMHLSKWKFQPARQIKSWKNTIYDQREELQDLLHDNPSLKSKIDEYVIKSYNKAVRDAIIETGLDESTFPKTCPWTLTNILNNKFFPD